MACIEARGLRKAFGTTIALDGVDLRVEEGRILGLIGPNGAGKTTALNVMAGRLRPDRGAVEFESRDITSMSAHARCRAGIALTHQIPHPFEAMTVFENVLVGATYGAGRPERDAYAACFAALALSGLERRLVGLEPTSDEAPVAETLGCAPHDEDLRPATHDDDDLLVAPHRRASS